MTETERSADACHVVASTLRATGEALGPQNGDSATFLQWASELEAHARYLRATPTRPTTLRLVRDEAAVSA